MKGPTLETDVVVVGGGNAALCAALSAREHGAKVLLLEKASREERGGNSRFTDGAIRVAFSDAAELAALLGEGGRERGPPGPGSGGARLRSFRP